MGRGSLAPTYGSDYAQRHPIAAWGRRYALERAVDATVRPALPPVLAGMRAVHAGRTLWESTRQFHDAPGLDVVGGEWWHSVADRKRAVARLSADFVLLSKDLADWMTAHHDETQAPAVAQWFAADVTPTLIEWKEFADREAASWWTRAATDWSAFEDWYDRLKRLRELARAHGIVLASPEPAMLPKTVWQRSASGRGNEAASWLGVLKLTIVAAVGITGFVTLYSVLSSFRKPKPDMEKQ